MSAATAPASVYVTDNFSEPMAAQHNFINNFDLDRPEEAMSAYQRYVQRNIRFPRFCPNISLESCTNTPSASSALLQTLPADELA